MTMQGRDRLAVFFGFHELRTVKFYKAVIWEFVETALLMLFVSGTSVTMDNGKPLITYTGAFNSAMAVAYLVWTFNHVSGAHMNPVITFCFLVTGHVSLTKTVDYTIAHCAGATAGAALVWSLVPPAWRGTLGSTTLAEEVTVAQGFAVEVICTFCLILGVFATSDQFRTDHAGSQALTIGHMVYIQSAWATALLMLFVSGTSVTMDNGKPLNTYTGAFNSAMAVAYLVWTFNHVSGAHMNPVITLCFLVTGHVSLTKTVAYTIAHCAGATAGAALVWGLVPPAWRGTLGSTTLAEEVTVAQLYWLAPAIGAVTGALLYEHILAETPQRDNISIHVEPSASRRGDRADQMTFTDGSIFIVEGNRTL